MTIPAERTNLALLHIEVVDFAVSMSPSLPNLDQLRQIKTDQAVENAILLDVSQWICLRREK
ncbi:18214_t:CDS:2 [Funneliformis geosporum]|uniref:17784_t:CDS:1 n=1 Tax=Funneliformis geosporum TaxID=1117311 RepID=A0A9W4X0R7_9GLOM|nr:18214_t:CDS:2 [Funneliformis geosporum]CAI2193578.1 17784_t:CDS:2 [Funneliformis geosporum]